MLRQKRQFIRAILFIGILMQAVLVIGAGRSVMAASSKKTKNTLILHNKDGSQYKKIVTTKSKVTLPTMAKKYGYTFLGWSKKKGTNTNPQYEVGESIKVSGTVHLYPVYFKRSTEEGLDVSNMTSGYDEVIFVGDSRIRLMQDKLESRYGKNAIKNVSFVAQGGSGLSWLKSTGIQKLRKLISEKKAENENVRIAVIFNHGVNDVKHKLGGTLNVSKLVNQYSSYMKKIGKELKAEGCDLYYMSVNPVNSAKYSTERYRSSADIRSFNEKLQKKLKGQYTFIDCYSYLIKNGYSTYCTKRGTDDGLHYTSKTCRRIYAYCMNFLKKHSG